MAAIAESSEANVNSPSPSLPPERVNHEDKSNTWGEAVPWIDNALQQAQLARKTTEDTFENAIVVTKSRLNRILTTSSAHFNQTLVSSIIIALYVCFMPTSCHIRNYMTSQCKCLLYVFASKLAV